jgi:hypothetical protein
MQTPCVYIPGPAPAVSVANIYSDKTYTCTCRKYVGWRENLVVVLELGLAQAGLLVQSHHAGPTQAEVMLEAKLGSSYLPRTSLSTYLGDSSGILRSYTG